MAPLAADPRQILVVLNQARRKALYILIQDIIDAMRSQLQLGKRLDPPNAELIDLRQDALNHFDDWRREVLKKLKDIVSAAEDNKILEARKKRQEEVAKLKLGSQEEEEEGEKEEDLLSFGTTENSDTSNAKDVSVLRQHYPPVPTRLTTIPVQDRREVLSCVLLVILSTGHYAAHSRVLALYLASSLELPLALLIAEETEIAKYLMLQSSAANDNNDGSGNRKHSASPSPDAMSGEAEVARRRQENQTSRFWKVGLASVAGAAVIGVTGGLAAPVVAGAIGGIMGSLGLGGVASFLGIFWANGALVGTLFGAFGAKMTGEMMDAYAREVNDFRFLPLRDEKPAVRASARTKTRTNDAAENQEHRRLRVTVGVNGWLREEADVTKPWRVLGDESEVFALRYEMDALLALGTSLEELVTSYAWRYIKLEILKNTVLASLRAVLWPAYLLGAASNIDNPFSLARNRSEKAGHVLADALINRAQGERPVTLIGYSLGARAIYSCLRTLADRRAFGLVDTVVLIGAPAPSSTAHWHVLRSVVAGRIFNVYSENDYILGFLYRTTSLQLGIAGLQPITDVHGIENLDLSREVAGHLRYPHLIAQILTRCGFPDVKGGEEAIERDEDLDRAERESRDDFPREARAVKGDTGSGVSSGGIVQGDGPSSPPTLPPRRATGSSNQPETPPWASSRGNDPLDLGSLGKKTGASSSPGAEEKTSPAQRHGQTNVRSDSWRLPERPKQQREFDVESDDGSYQGIVMMDNDC
ncbi:DUF726-domain-containing protein [Sodiomyces alkalinus F11]|uniref:DUF726-domain-containing protein n=1 Tax=Sodiomyces alkalinus (strain CBS 110278 / VKM F-3762 / F11) TaxID=1314773 RepID=A0A3N2PKG8_SODAK|nr:DUF726-domain-containing protein [Sodiomyces alkalinus F11]ROT35017.1 DUF726-domain-containing protein [Sodiomyces alkalinus F11]